jgi:hypothetical protein
MQVRVNLGLKFKTVAVRLIFRPHLRPQQQRFIREIHNLNILLAFRLHLQRLIRVHLFMPTSRQHLKFRVRRLQLNLSDHIKFRLWLI